MVVACIGWCVGLGGDAVASCEPGYYTICSRDSGNYDNCTDCECVPCDDGYTSNGLGVVYDEECHMTSNSGCYEPPCAGHDFPCPSYFSENMRCKKLDYVCPSGCGVYSVCNIQNGEIVYSDFMDGSCHIEGNACYSNSRDCKDFPIQGAYFTNYLPSGQAEWRLDKWDVSGCRYDVQDIGFAFANCPKYTMYSKVSSENSHVASVSSKITYTTERQYCSKCPPGYLPFVEPSPNNGIDLRPENAPPGDWGTYKCQNMVRVPNYADGCDIDWTVSMGTVANSCQKPCPAGMETIENGATSIEDCVPDVNQIYHDSTGTFTLGTERC